jgi:environmental stress-induced protein Ves
MPWRNGAGSTTELLVEPPLASLQTGFQWRLSMAGLATSGPFSAFPGYDRTLLLLEGRGVALDHGAHGRALLAQPLDACAFPGEWPTQGVLVDGPCRDFNVMSARASVRHEVHVLRPGPDGTSLPEGPVVVVFCVSGRLGLAALGETLEAGELMRLDGHGALKAVGLAPDTALIAAVFRPVGKARTGTGGPPHGWPS